MMKFEEVRGHRSLYDEIVTRDAYKLQSLVFKPDVIFDIGANIGMFTHYAHRLFPDAKIISVEPHPKNFAILKEHAPEGTVLLRKAIGNGKLQYYPDVSGHPSGGGESYVSIGFGYELPFIGDHPIENSDIQAVLLDELYAEYVKDGQNVVIKLDCEGAENLLFAHQPSADVLRKADFVTMEFHPYWDTNNADVMASPIPVFSVTHRWDLEVPMFYAWRKPDDEPIAGRQDFGRLLAKDDLLGNAAEIGVCSGSYSRDILGWGVKHLLLVDPWRELPTAPSGISDEQHEAYYQECLGYIKGSENRTTILRMLSVDAAAQTPDKSLDWCYIDANHRYEGISVDLELWWPKVRSGGILAGHDYLAMELGVNRAVTEFAEKCGLRVHVVIEHQHDASFWIRKP